MHPITAKSKVVGRYLFGYLSSHSIRNRFSNPLSETVNSTRRTVSSLMSSYTGVGLLATTIHSNSCLLGSLEVCHRPSKKGVLLLCVASSTSGERVIKIFA